MLDVLLIVFFVALFTVSILKAIYDLLVKGKAR